MTRNWMGMMVLGLVGIAGLDGQWPQFRGPNGSGVAAKPDSYPAEFSQGKNLVWKTAVPYGQSSPVVVGNRLYVTASEGDRLLTICLNANDGRELWRKEIKRTRSHKTYPANDPASPTPAADASGVFVFFPDFGLVAYTPEGKQRWTLPLGPFKNFYGMSGSPVLADGFLVLICDQASGSFLLALDAKTGRQRWKTERTGSTVGWSTPMVFRPSTGAAQLIVLGTTRLDSYYFATGERRWWMPVASGGALGTPIALGDTLVVSTLGNTEPYMPTFEAALAQYDKDKDGRLSQAEFSGDKDLGEHFGWIDENEDHFLVLTEWNVARDVGTGDWGAVAIRPNDAQGQLAPSAVLWRFKKNLPYIPAPLLYEDVLYLVRTGGIITSVNPATGEVLKQGRSSNALGDYYASPVAADHKVFLASTEGKMTVLKAGGNWEVLGVNEVGEEIHATPGLSGGRIYVRTKSSLYCFGAI